MRAMSMLIPAIPAFVALSANSPFWRGHETGHVAYRHRILAAMPNYGLPTQFNDWRACSHFLDAALRAGMIHHFKDIHWDIRPHPDFGTLEIRAMDAASDLTSLHALVAFARSMTICFATAPVEDVRRILPLDLPFWAQKQNHYRAAHLGLGAEYIVDESGNHRPLRDLVAELIDFCRPTAAKINEAAGLELTEKLLTGVPGYARQLSAYEDSDSLRSVVNALKHALIDGTQPE